MPRREKDIDVQSDPMLAAFALELRLKRAQAGPQATYRRLAQDTRYNPSTLSKALAGKYRPSWEVTRALARALGEDEQYWRRRWLETGAHTHRSAGSRRRGRAHRVPELLPDLTYAASADDPVGEFVRQMRLLIVSIGSPSLRELEGRNPRLPRATLSDALRSQTLPTYRLMREFLLACGVPEPDRAVWSETWFDIKYHPAPCGLMLAAA